MWALKHTLMFSFPVHGREQFGFLFFRYWDFFYWRSQEPASPSDYRWGKLAVMIVMIFGRTFYYVRSHTFAVTLYRMKLFYNTFYTLRYNFCVLVDNWDIQINFLDSYLLVLLNSKSLAYQ